MHFSIFFLEKAAINSIVMLFCLYCGQQAVVKEESTLISKTYKVYFDSYPSHYLLNYIFFYFIGDYNEYVVNS